MNSNFNHSTKDIFTKDFSWKKIITDKLMNKINTMRRERMNNIYLSKSKFITEMKNENIIIDESESITLAEYFDKVLSIMSTSTYIDDHYTTSRCPICSEIVIATDNRVICINQCFEFMIPTKYFNENFTLDNLMDLLLDTKRKHFYCNSNILALTLEDNVYLACEKCLNNN